MADLRIGSLCSGYGGLDLGLMSVVGGSVAWHVEYDKAPAKILAHHWPDVPNYGDITTTDWTQVEPVDWLTAGYPCQPFSHAGKRKGTTDERHIWPSVAGAISVLRPRWFLGENVRGHLTLGFDSVLADLARLGYDATWGLVRAADAGAPHSRARLFIVATDARSTRAGRDTGAVLGAQEQGRLHSDGSGTSGVHHGAAADAISERAGLGAAVGRQGRAAGDGSGATLLRPADRPTGADGTASGREPSPADSCGERHGRGQDSREVGRLDRGDESETRERERSRTIAGDRGAEAATDTSMGRPQGRSDVCGGQPDIAWGAYEPAIRRWAAVTGRPAPAPTEVSHEWLRARHRRFAHRDPRPAGMRGSIRRFLQPEMRLAPRFVEWMMGLPAGHVTDVDIPRNAQLKALGNGVVPAQAALALRMLLPLTEVAA